MDERRELLQALAELREFETEIVGDMELAVPVLIRIGTFKESPDGHQSVFSRLTKQERLAVRAAIHYGITAFKIREYSQLLENQQGQEFTSTGN